MVKTRHKHAWNPVPGWQGRYRCPVCGVFGHRVSRAGSGVVSRVITPYKCRVCSAPAVAKDQRGGLGAGEWRCREHRVEQ